MANAPVRNGKCGNVASWLQLRLQSQSIETARSLWRYREVCAPRSVRHTRLDSTRHSYLCKCSAFSAISNVGFAICIFLLFLSRSRLLCACETDGEYCSMSFRRIFIFNFHFALVDISPALPQLKWQLMSCVCVQRIFIKIIYLF